MPALKPATIGQKLLTDFGQNRPLTTVYEQNVDWLKKNAIEIALSLSDGVKKVVGEEDYNREYFALYKWFKKQVDWI